jgi:hypothetical protein
MLHSVKTQLRCQHAHRSSKVAQGRPARNTSTHRSARSQWLTHQQQGQHKSNRPARARAVLCRSVTDCMDAAKQPARRNGSHNPAEACWKASRVQIKLTPMRGRKILPAENDRLPNQAACCPVYRRCYSQRSWSTGGSAHKANMGQNYHNSGTCHQGRRVPS